MALHIPIPTFLRGLWDGNLEQLVSANQESASTFKFAECDITGQLVCPWRSREESGSTLG
jgi:hypothetical protein